MLDLLAVRPESAELALVLVDVDADVIHRWTPFDTVKDRTVRHDGYHARCQPAASSHLCGREQRVV